MEAYLNENLLNFNRNEKYEWLLRNGKLSRNKEVNVKTKTVTQNYGFIF